MIGNFSALRSSTALPLVLAAAGAAFVAPSATLADCTPAPPSSTSCTDITNLTTTIGTGPTTAAGRSLNVADNAVVTSTNRPAISLGDSATITIGNNGQVNGVINSGSGNFGSGPNLIEFNSFGALNIGTGVKLTKTGTVSNSEVINVHGYGNTIINRGTISATGSAALWFEDTTTGSPRNVVDNFGIIAREVVNGVRGPVFGTQAGAGIEFRNETSASVLGDLSFANGNDELDFFSGSSVSGSINGGGGTNTLQLDGALGTFSSLPGALTNFQTLVKDGAGTWTITGTLSGFQSTTVEEGTLALTGNNANYTAGVLVQPGGTLEARAQSLPTTSTNTNNIRNDGTINFVQPDSGVYAGQIVDGPSTTATGRVQKSGTGTTRLTANNTYVGKTTVLEGSLLLGNGTASGSIAGGVDVHAGAVFGFDRSNAYSFGGLIEGAGSVLQTGAGTTTLTGANTYSGGTSFARGVLQVATDGNLGAAAGGLAFNGGTLRTTADMTTARAAQILGGNGTIDTGAYTLNYTGNIGGVGGLSKAGTGTMVLTGTGSYLGDTVVSGGTLRLGIGGTTGGIASTGAVQLLGTSTNLIFDRSDAITQAGVISGTGNLTKTGAGDLVLYGTNTYTGTTKLDQGRLFVNGDQSEAIGALTTASGTTLGGFGTIGGNVTVAGHATLAPGDPGEVGTLTIGGNLTLNATSTLEYALGQPNVAGGPMNDLTNVGGNLNLDGTINVSLFPGGSLSTGVYRVFNFDGTLANNGLTIGTIPEPGFFVQTAVPNQINLVNTSGETLSWWDGDVGPKNNGVPNGGDGIWQLAGVNDNWTGPNGLVNAPYSNGAFAVFTGNDGTVTVDNGLGSVTASGMQFMTDGYLVQGDPITLAGASTSEIRVGAGDPADAAVAVEIAADLTGTTRVEKTDFGTLVLSGTNSYTGGTAINGGVLEVTADANLGAAPGALSLDGGTLRTPADFTNARTTSLGAAGGTFDTDAFTLTQATAITGGGSLTKTGGGSMVMNADNAYGGGTIIDEGTLQLGTGGTAGWVTGDILDNGVLVVDRSDAVALDGTISGTGSLEQVGGGTTTLGGTNSYAGGTTVTSGILQVSQDANLGAAAGPLAIDDATLNSTATFAMARATTIGAGGATFDTDAGTELTQTGTIGGAGALIKTDTGTLVLGGTNSYAGGTSVLGGTVEVEADAGLGAMAGPLTLDTGTLRTTASFATARDTTLGGGGGTFDTAAGTALAHGGTVAGPGALTKAGQGDLSLSGTNSYAGATTVAAGGLYVNGDQSAATGTTSVASGATLGGGGSIGANVVIAGGATLAPGPLGAVPGTLSIAGSLGLAATSILDYSFGAANVVGGALNDLTEVGGDLTLDGTLNVVTTPGGSFDPGIYRVISYTGGLTNNGLGIGTIPSPDFFVQTSIPQQVNLINTNGLELRWWDGDAGPKNNGVPDGGNGTWQSATGNDNWTTEAGTPNAPFRNGSFAIFPTAPGTVTVDDSLGAVTVSGMQFAVDGYVVQGDPVALVGVTETPLRVGDGTSAGAAMSATIDSVLTGGSTLVKGDAGTLVLTAANTYTGGTAIRGGTLGITSNANLGAAAGGLTFDGGTLQATADVTTARTTTIAAGSGTIDTTTATVMHNGDIAGDGALTKVGGGSLVLTGTGTYAGGTTIADGTLQLGAGATTGSIVGDIANEGLLVVDRSNELTLDGTISGAGGVQQVGEGTTTLVGTNSYAGGTEVLAGTVAVAADAGLGDAPGPLTLNGGTLSTTASFATTRDTTLGTGGGTFLTAAGTALSHDGTLAGPGALTKAGAGDLNLTGTNGYAGPTTVVAGGIYVNGDQSSATGATLAQPGATLGGDGTIGGNVTIAGGGTLAPGKAGALPGTLAILGDLALASTATLNYSFGEANVAGGPTNDLTEVGGDLALDGTLNVVTTPGGSFDPGVYRVINYVGALTDDGLAVGTIPSSGWFVQTSVAQQVNLINTAGLNLSWWDGDAGPKNNGVPDGGNGTWQDSGGNDNWTEATGSINAPFSDGAFAIFSGADGTVTVDDSLGAVTVSGMQFLTDNYLVQGDPITLVGDPETTIRVGDGTDGSAGITATVAADLTGDFQLVKTDLGTLVLSGANSYTGGTAIRGGVIEIGSDANLGAANGGLTFGSGTLRATADVATNRATMIEAGGGTIDTTTTTVTHGGDIAGAGALAKAGAGTLILTGTGTYSGGTTIAGGTVQLGAGGTTGSIMGNVVSVGVLAFDRSNTLDLTGAISGPGEVQQIGSGTTRLASDNTYTGTTTVAAGGLYVNGDQTAATGATSVASGGTIGGSGTIGSDVSLVDGATLAPGDVGVTPGTLAINGGLALSAGSFLDYTFGQAGVVGGALNDLTEVAGDLTLDGTLNVVTTPGGSFDPGIYRVISYGGGLTDDGLAIGTIPTSGWFVQTSIPQQINLVNTAGLHLDWWDGDAGPKNNGVANGGDGTWQNSEGNDNWTNGTGTINAPFTDGSFAVFPGAAGTVTVDDSLGDIMVSGMQFLTDGYLIEGDTISLVGAPTILRVGDGTTAGADLTATISSQLQGTSQLVKSDLGTLILTANNSYTGGTAITGGVLEVASNTNLGASSGSLAINGATLRTTSSFTLARPTTLGSYGGTFDTTDATITHPDPISGPGELTKTGAGTLILLGTNSYTGGTVVDEGTLQVGDGGTRGVIVGDILNNGTLIANRSDDFAFPGTITGNGRVIKRGPNLVAALAKSSYSGSTTLEQGTLRAGAPSVFSPASAFSIEKDATLDLADLNQAVGGLANAGRVSLGHVPNTRLNVNGDYVGQGGVLHFTTTLGGDDSPTDRMSVAGDTSGQTYVEVHNDGGSGAKTTNGIKIIDVGGASKGNFTLVGDYVLNGQHAVVAGAYAYGLFKNGVSTPTDGDWYLRSGLIQPNPGPPQVQPGVPVYEGYAATLLALNGLPTMQQRIGNRYWSGPGNPAGVDPENGLAVPPDGYLEDKRAWARFEVSNGRLEPDVSNGDDPRYDLHVTRLQVGIDRPVREMDDGMLIAGVTFNYGTVDNDVHSQNGDGTIESTGYGFGGSLTWFRDDGVYVDGQAQMAWYDSDLSSDLVDDELASGNNGFGWALEVEGGKRIKLNDTWTLTPQGQVSYSSVDFDSFVDPFEASVSMDDGASMPLRLGVSADQETSSVSATRGRARTHLYGIANFYYDLIDDTSISVAGESFHTDNQNLWGSLGVGATYTWRDGAYGLYTEGMVASSLSDFGDNYTNKVGLGFRAAW